MTTGPTAPQQPAKPVLLVVGNLPDWERSGRGLPQGDGVKFIDFNDLNAEKVIEVGPDVVISGLFGPGYDAMDIALALQDAGFRGRYRVIADRIPKPGLVRSEVRHAAPKIDFDVINLRGELAAYL